MSSLRNVSVRGGVVAALLVGAWSAGCGSKGGNGGGAGTGASAGNAPATSFAAPAGQVRLTRTTHPLARPELDRGALDLGKHIANVSMMFKLTPAQERDRDALREALTDPKSPSYHQWLTPEQYAARFGAKPADIEKATSWLASQGFELQAPSRLGARVTFSGSVAKLQSAFQTEMRRYEVGGKMHYAMASAPAVPTELAGFVGGLHNTHDFYLRPPKHQMTVIDPDTKNGNTVGLAPPDWAAIYNVAPLYTNGVAGTPLDGTGVSIAIVGIAKVAESDIDAFRTKYGLPATNLTQTLVPKTGAPTGDTGGAGGEAILDIEWAGGIAKGANINYVYTGADDGNVDTATFYAIENNLAPILSESWAGCELGLTPSDADVTQILGSAANVLGITYLASSGDSGAASCIDFGAPGLYVNIPAAFPGVTSVGGTEFPKNTLTFGGDGIATGYSDQESVWNESNNPKNGVGAGGGGISVTFLRPSYQSAIPNCTIVGALPTGVTPSSMRQVPDISASAAAAFYPYFIECALNAGGTDCDGSGTNPRVIGFGGTSASAPSTAGVVAIMNQATGTRLGNINPLLYTLNASTPSAFHDVTAGSNQVVCKGGTDVGCPAGNEYGYAAATGYDCATGLGTLDALNLVSAVASLSHTSTTLTASPTTAIGEGSNVSLSAQISVTGANGNALGGVVSFAFVTSTIDGAPDLSWSLGTAPITGGTTTSGSATLPPAPIPPGVIKPGAQFVDVVATYAGDANHLGSLSAKVRLTFGAISLAVAPATSTVESGTAIQFTATGGVAPVRWFINTDSTCDSTTDQCSTLDENTGAFVAGPTGGSVQVIALDKFSAEAVGTVTVTPKPDAGSDSGTKTPDAGSPTEDASTGADSGPITGEPDSGATPVDASQGDASSSGGGGGSSSSGCTITRGGASGTGADSGAFAGMALGLAVMMRRRRRS